MDALPRPERLRRFERHRLPHPIRQRKEPPLENAGSPRQVLADLPGIDEAFIFGSYAAGSDRVGSDVDLLVVGSPGSDELRRRIGRVGRDIRRDVNLVELSAVEFRKLREKREPFIRDVLSHRRLVLVAGKKKRG